MSKTLATLIKLHQHEVDAQRKVLAACEAIVERLRQELADLHTSMNTEKEIARHDAEAATRWPAYLNFALRREKELGHQITLSTREANAARDELQRRFETLKKFEQAKLLADQETALEAARLEQAVLDEIAATQFNRRE